MVISIVEEFCCFDTRFTIIANTMAEEANTMAEET
jgi:hypothetical protein